MKKAGYTLIIVGFLAAAWVAVQHVTEINWAFYAPAALAPTIGVILVRRRTKPHVEHADTIAANISDIGSSIRRIVDNTTRLNREKETIHTYDMRDKIDELLVEDLNVFAEARETITIKYGLHNYAEIMSHFAAGERYINRVWSCSADGYIDEVREYIGKAEEQFRAVQTRFEELSAQA